jgi:hypothetical protein
MFKLFKCRRSSLALIGMVLLTVLGIHLKVDTSGSIAMIIMGVAAANAGEGVASKVSKKNQNSSSDGSSS